METKLGMREDVCGDMVFIIHIMASKHEMS